MNVKSLLAGFTLLVLFSATAGAAVISRDWKTPGDGLLTYDTVSGREWLDLTETRLSQYGSFELVLMQTQFGGDFEGFVPASITDVIELASSANIHTDSIAFALNYVATDDLITRLSPTLLSGNETRSALGLTKEFASTLPTSPDQIVGAFEVIPIRDHAGLTFPLFANLGDRPHQVVGVFLYRPVPEPKMSVLAFMAIGMAGSYVLFLYFRRFCDPGLQSPLLRITRMTWHGRERRGKQLQTRNPRCWPRINVSRLAVECCTTPVDFARRWGAE